MLQRSEKDFPKDYNPPARLALVYLKLKRYDDALAASDRALALVYGPRKLRVFAVRADIQAAMGNAAAARKTLEDALAYAEALPEGQRSAGDDRGAPEAGGGGQRRRRRAVDRCIPATIRACRARPLGVPDRPRPRAGAPRGEPVGAAPGALRRGVAVPPEGEPAPRDLRGRPPLRRPPAVHDARGPRPPERARPRDAGEAEVDRPRRAVFLGARQRRHDVAASSPMRSPTTSSAPIGSRSRPTAGSTRTSPTCRTGCRSPRRRTTRTTSPG